MKMEGSDETEMIKEHFLKNSMMKRRGVSWTLPLILANGMLVNAANYGLWPNMTLYLVRKYNMRMTTASNILFYGSAATNFMPVIAAIIADSYVGRFNMIGFGSVVCILGMTLLWLTSAIPKLRPPPCNGYANDCSSATIQQFSILCTSFAVIALGAGGIRSSSLAFGADQTGNKDGRTKDGGALERYFSWYYATQTLSVLFALSCLVYIQDKMGWEVGFGVCVVLMVFATLCFFLGTPFYVKVKAKASLIVELVQVVVASCKKRQHIDDLSSENINTIFHRKKGSTLLSPTENLRFLNKACIIEDAEQELTPCGRARDPWSLCTVDQVEDLKALVKLIPLWSTGIVLAITLSQNSFSILQATSMDRRITANFEIPAGSFATFSVISLILWVLLYNQAILPMVSRLRGKPTQFNAKQRMGAGIFLSCVCMIVTAALEGIRRSLANKEGLSNNPQATVPMSGLWLVPQYVLIGIAEGLNAVAQNELYISEFPKSMSSIASTLFSLGMSAGNLLASFLMSTIDDLTGRGSHESWVSTNINKGHYDYYFCVLSGLSILNFMYFLLCSRTYGPCRVEQEKARDGEDVVGLLH